MSDQAEAAKALIASHEDNVRRGDLDAIMSNMADDIVMIVPGAPPVVGADACRAMYLGLLAMGVWDFVHDYHGVALDGETTLLHGVARGTLSANGGETQAVANSFLIVTRPNSEGILKAWRAAFGPSGEL